MSNADRPGELTQAEWLATHREELAALGLPPRVIENEFNWQLFLEDGIFFTSPMNPPDIDVDNLPAKQAERLWQFLVQHFPERDKGGSSPLQAIDRLEANLNEGPYAR